MLHRMVTNPEDVKLAHAPASLAPSGVRGVAPGEYEYVIITQTDWVDDFQPLADWRTKQGMPATIVTTDWIYNEGGYAGAELKQIRAFVADAHTTWGATYFLLGGDTDLFPYHVHPITVPGHGTDDIANYTYYADYDEDWICEVHLGNASVRSAAQISAFVEKVFTYEKNPPLTDYATHAAFFAFDIHWCGDAHGESFKEDYITGPHLPPSWTLSTEYDSEPGTHKADVLAYLSQGHHLVNHFDHCNSEVMGVGWICHSELMLISDVAALTNGGRPSILFSIGCHPCYFPATACIGEVFMQHTNGGTVAFIGNTGIAWEGPAYDPDKYSLGQDRLFYRNLFDYGIERLGENFTILKNDEYDPYDPLNLHQYAFTQLHLLGDPGMPVWTADPQGLTVSHDDSVNAGQPCSFSVEVSNTGGPLDGATVCLWKEGEVYEVAQTVSGAAIFELPAMTDGVLYVTTVLHDYLPYEGQALVQTDPMATPRSQRAHSVRLTLTSISPNPFHLRTAITYAIPPSGGPGAATLSVYNCLGQRVRTLVDDKHIAGTHRVTWNGADDAGHEVASGVYYCRLRWNGESRCERMMLLR